MYENLEKSYKTAVQSSGNSAGMVSNNVSVNLNDIHSDDFGGTVSGGNIPESFSPVYYVVDSAGNYLPVDISGPFDSQELLEAQTVSSGDASEASQTLEKINHSLTLIVFLLLFFWAERKVKNAVRCFAGRNIHD